METKIADFFSKTYVEKMHCRLFLYAPQRAAHMESSGIPRYVLIAR